ncbi:MAG: tyrosine-type recombinase/integrase [Bryobacteraceae bacterium]
MPLNLYDAQGLRKYLTAEERDAFLKAAEDNPREVRTFCGTLLYAGCRIAEALALTADRVDLKDRRIVFESLKKRKRGVFRPVPVPPPFLDTLDLVPNIRAAQKREGRGKRNFPVGLVPHDRMDPRMRGNEGGEDRRPTRHAERLAARFRRQCHRQQRSAEQGEKWLGHADLKTTVIYADSTGAEEEQIAGRMWS